jgi:hypothetical protein
MDGFSGRTLVGYDVVLFTRSRRHLRRRIMARHIGNLSIGNRIEANLDCAMLPIVPTAWMPIVYSATAYECVKLLCEPINAEHFVLNRKR